MSKTIVPLTFRKFVLMAASLFLTAIHVEAQMAYRLRGSVRNTADAPIAGATIHAAAITGFRGQPFAGAREHIVLSTGTGEWSINGLEAGLWIVSTDATDMLPSVIVLPVKLSQRQQISAIGNSLSWRLPLSAESKNQHQALTTAAELIAGRKSEEAVQALTVALGPNISDNTRVMAGELALLAHNAGLANAIFAMVLKSQPKHARATIGAASAALLNLEWERAGKLLWEARDLAPKELKPALASAIDDIRGLTTSAQ